MTWRSGMLAAAAFLLVASISAAQGAEPIPRIVVDARGASLGLPTATGWTPVVPMGGEVPSRALGFEAGAHFHFGRVGPVRFGMGGSFLIGQGTFTPEPPAADSMQTTLPPEVSTRFISVSPQISVNFGRRLGWSHLSIGLGRARVRSEASRPANAGVPALIEGGWSRVLNYGGGARWFINDHFGIGFDLRWHQLASVAADSTRPAAPRETMFTATVGISLQ
jgi:hypothetical protein